MLLSSHVLAFLDTIERMKDPESVKAFMLDPANAHPDPIFPRFSAWNDVSLADGYPGLLLFFSTLQQCGFVDEGKEDIAYRYVLKIKEVLEENGCDNFSLFTGVSGICFALQQASCKGTRYQRLLNSLHTHLFKNIEKVFLEPMRYHFSHNQPSFAYLYDPIQGICGIGRYLLETLSVPSCFEFLRNIVQALINLSQPLNIDGKWVPGWYGSPADPLNVDYQSLYPKGNFNLGLAHGITGILAFLAIALMRGVEINGQKEAIICISSWIRAKSFLKDDVIQWPYSVSWEEEVEKADQDRIPSRDAWCYGAPGIARTLFLAGKALANEELKNFAANAFRGIFCKSRLEWELPGPMLCHGIAGLLLITCAMAQEKECEDLVYKVNELEQMLLSFYNPDFPFGFKDVEQCKQGGEAQISKVGYLEGTTGVLLTLLNPSSHQSQCHLPFLIHA